MKKNTNNKWSIFKSIPLVIIYIVEILVSIIFAINNEAIYAFFKSIACFAFLTFIIVYLFFIQENNSKQPEPPRIQCPYCKSYYTEKISTLNRGASTVAFGLASSKIGKQWHCKSCNSDF